MIEEVLLDGRFAQSQGVMSRERLHEEDVVNGKLGSVQCAGGGICCMDRS